MRRPASSLRCKGQRQFSGNDPHIPLQALWLLQIALQLGWHRKENPARPPLILDDEGFARLTGIEMPYRVDEDGDLVVDRSARRKLTESKVAARFEKRIAEIERAGIPDDLPLFRNVALFGQRLGLGPADEAILRFALAITAFKTFRGLIQMMSEEVSQQQFVELLATISELPPADVAAALREESPLIRSGVILLERGSHFLHDKIDLIDQLGPLLLTPGITEEELLARFLRPAGCGSLGLNAFPHLASDIAIMLPYLRNAMARGEPGINLLFYGQPGTGKTELAKALAEELGSSLFEIAYADESGNPIKGKDRLRAYNLCQHIAVKMPDVLLMFDEIEDVLRPDMGGLMMSLFGGGEVSHSNGKAWVNRTLERNPVPAIWITNNPRIDPAYLRRFDYSVKFPIPPQSVRMAIARHHFGALNPAEEWLGSIAANEHASPAQLERAARIARIVADSDPDLAMRIAGQTLDRSMALLQQKRLPGRNVLRTGYDLQFANVDVDLSRIVAGLKSRPRGSFCFYGPAGTGKSELGRHMAEAIDKPVLLRRASDILSMWVGESEKNIAAMFDEARQRDAVLILDEADSFLSDRRDAHASWEVTQVNELLTQMEAFEGIFICTTNLMQKLDQASLRRFAFKLKFDYLRPAQREALFMQELGRLGGDVARAGEWLPNLKQLGQLTPGDFAVAVRQFELWGEVPDPGELFEQLRKECVAKGAPARGIGFTN